MSHLIQAHIRTFTETLRGTGPWVLAIKGYDEGVFKGWFPGIFAGVKINGEAFTVTGVEETKFLGTNVTQPDNWTTPSFRVNSIWKDAEGQRAARLTCMPVARRFGKDFAKKLRDSHTPAIGGIFLPDCMEGLFTTIKHPRYTYLRLQIVKEDIPN